MISVSSIEPETAACLAIGATSLTHAREARRLATCDGPPDYTYKVAYDEAGALLRKSVISNQ